MLIHFCVSFFFDKFIIGCNVDYLYGSDICEIYLFGDFLWFEEHKQKLAKYKGVVFTSSPARYNTKIKWLWTMMRESTGVYDDRLGWNFNTGASAINLAALLGAKRVYLLGFDMKLTNGMNNWHRNTLSIPDADVFEKFISGFKFLKASMDKKYPDIEVINITDDSGLNLYPKVGLKEFWKGQ